MKHLCLSITNYNVGAYYYEILIQIWEAMLQHE